MLLNEKEALKAFQWFYILIFPASNGDIWKSCLILDTFLNTFSWIQCFSVLFPPVTISLISSWQSLCSLQLKINPSASILPCQLFFHFFFSTIMHRMLLKLHSEKKTENLHQNMLSEALPLPWNMKQTVLNMYISVHKTVFLATHAGVHTTMHRLGFAQ